MIPQSFPLTHNAFIPNAFQHEEKIFLYSRHQHDLLINFYIDQEGELHAESLKNEKSSALEILEFPIGMKKNLLHPERRDTIKKALEQSYFKLRDNQISICPKGLGGWNDEVHKGYVPHFYSNEDSTIIARTYRACGFNQEQFDASVNYRNTELEGTKRWVEHVELTPIGHISAKWIAYNTCNVDYQPETGPFWPMGQGWHFNFADDPEGSLGDTRIVLSLACLSLAISYRLQSNLEQALKYLGKGLHPLQDVFAHRDVFVKRWAIKGKTYCEHVSTPYSWKADDPYFIDSDVSKKNELNDKVDGKLLNVRYSDTKTATYVYLLAYRLFSEPGFASSGQYEYLKEKLNIPYRVSKIGHPNFKPNKFMQRLEDNLSVNKIEKYVYMNGLSLSFPPHLGSSWKRTIIRLTSDVETLRSKLSKEKLFIGKKNGCDALLELRCIKKEVDDIGLDELDLESIKRKIARIKDDIYEINRYFLPFSEGLQHNSILALISQCEDMIPKIKVLPKKPPTQKPLPDNSLLPFFKLISVYVAMVLITHIFNSTRSSF